MKYLIAFGCSFLFLAQAHAATLTDTLCGTGGIATCSNPGPEVSSLIYNSSNGQLIVTINDVQYQSARYTATEEGATVYAADGSSHVVQTVFATWITRTRSGRGQTVTTHWELKSGSVL
jgi:hypothetical protein